MAERTYLHDLYPGLTPQIEQAISEGIPLDMIHDTISGKVNQAKQEGIPDDIINKTIGASGPVPRGYNPFLAQAYTAAGALNKGLAQFTKGMVEPGQYISEKLGFGRSKLFDDMVDKVTKVYASNADYWEEKAKEKGVGFLDELIGEAFGGGVTGVPEFMLNVPYATAQGAIEAKSKGQSELLGATIGAVKRGILGKLFHVYGQMTKPLAATAMGGTMALETAAAGGSAEEIAKAGGTGVIYSLGGKGRIGIKQIKDNLTGGYKYEPVVRNDAEIAIDEAKKIEETKKAEEVKKDAVQREEKRDEGRKGEGEKVEAPAETYETFIKTAESEGPGADQARKETLLMGKLSDKGQALKDKVSELAALPEKERVPKSFTDEETQSIKEVAWQYDRAGAFAKAIGEGLGITDKNGLWKQLGAKSAKEFWQKSQKDRPVTPALEDFSGIVGAEGVSDVKGLKQEYQNSRKVATVMADVNKTVDQMIDTADRMSRAAFDSGDRAGALREHQKMVALQKNREIIKRNQKALRDEVNTTIARIKRLAGLKSIDPDYSDRIAQELEGTDLAVRSEKTLARREAMKDFVERMEAEGDMVLIPEGKLALLKKRPVNDMTLDELRALDDVVKQLAHMGSVKKKLLANKAMRDVKAARTSFIKSIIGNAYKWKEQPSLAGKAPSERQRTTWQQFQVNLGKIVGTFIKSEYVLDKLDGFPSMEKVQEGIGHKLIRKPRQDAANELYALRDETKNGLAASIEPIKKDFSDMVNKKDLDIGEGRTWTRMEAIAVYWNSKNQGNRRALEKGLALTPDKINEIIGKLKPEEIKFADDVMAVIQSKGPAIAKVLRKLTGEKMRFEPDYFPLWFDRELNTKLAEREQVQDLMRQVYSKVGPQHGFTTSRVGGTEAPYLSWDVVIQHLDKVDYFIANALAVRDQQKLLLDPEVRRHIEARAGEGAYNELVNSLKDWANPERKFNLPTMVNWMERGAGKLRNNASVVVMGLKLSTALIQPTGILNAVPHLGASGAMRAMTEFYSHPWKNLQMVHDASPDMAHRRFNFDRDVKHFLDTEAKGTILKKHEWLKEHAFWLIQTLDIATTYPTWLGFYNKGMKTYQHDHTKSVDYATMMTLRTQGSGMAKDLPAILRGPEIQRIFFMFHTFASAQFNEAARTIMARSEQKASSVDVIKSLWWLFVVPAVVQAVMKKREDTTAGDIAKETVQNAAQAIPGFGPVMNAMTTGMDYQPSAIFEMPKEAIRFGQTLDDPEKALKHATMLTGYLTGLPSRQAILTVQYAMDLLEGQNYDPFNLVYRKREKKGGGWK